MLSRLRWLSRPPRCLLSPRERLDHVQKRLYSAQAAASQFPSLDSLDSADLQPQISHPSTDAVSSRTRSEADGGRDNLDRLQKLIDSFKLYSKVRQEQSRSSSFLLEPVIDVLHDVVVEGQSQASSNRRAMEILSRPDVRNLTRQLVSSSKTSCQLPALVSCM